METLIRLFDRTLLTSIEAALLICLILLLLTLFGKKLSSSWRYALWIMLIVKLVLPWLPGNLGDELQWIRLPGVAMEHLLPIDRAELQTINPLGAAMNEPDNNSLLSNPEAPYEATVLSPSSTITNLPHYALKFAVIVWLLGTAASLFYFLAGYLRMSAALRKEARIVVPAHLHNLFLQIRNQYGIRFNVGLRVTNLVPTPALFGLFSPTVLIPRNIMDLLNDGEWDCVFRHELSHYKRMDIPVNLFSSIVASAHWFNPLVWYSLHRMRIDQETACDASVLASSMLKETYIACIVKILEFGVTKRTVSAGVGFSGYKNQIVRRIIMIRNYQSHTKRASLLGFVLLAMTAIFVLSSTFAAGKEQQVELTEPSAHAKEEVTFRLPASGKIVTDYGFQTHPITKKKTLHDGIDISNKKGTKIYAAADGKVIKAEYDSQHGRIIMIEHKAGLQTEYRHLNELSVKVGDSVKSGTVIGFMGSTGQATGPHLHFSITKDGEYVDPALQIEQ
jgi:beta-lactamase regulating signal transducer with metallopeptidase domain